MNKSHITDEQVKIVLQMYWHADNPSKIFSNVDIQDMRRSLEAAFPEPSIQELLSDEERSARHDYPQQPAAFGKLIVTEDMARELWHEFQKPTGWVESTEFLQSFVDAHSIKPIAFADRMPEEEVLIWDCLNKQWVVCHYENWNKNDLPDEFTHWLPASALPIPEPAVDPSELAWRKYEGTQDMIDDLSTEYTFKAGYEAAQAGGAELRKELMDLVERAFWGGCAYDRGCTDLNQHQAPGWDEWSSQHPILKDN